MKKHIFVILLCLCICMFTACTEADKVNANLSKQADYFESERKARIINAAKAMYLMPPGFGDPVIWIWP